MSSLQTQAEIEYPESDGKPMGETDLHRDWMVRILDMLKHRYRGQRVYVSGDLLVYYKEGDPKEFVVPEVFVVRDCDPGRRKVFKTWMERRTPEVVWEVTSRSTKRNDTQRKPEIYAAIGVKEYFVYDPTSDYLRPPLRGFRLSADGYQEIRPEHSGGLLSEVLGIVHHLEAGELVLTDSQTGGRLLTGEEAEAIARQAEAAAREAAEEEVRRLRALLEGKGH